MNSPEKQDTCDFCDPHGNAMRGLPVGHLREILPPRTWPCGGGGSRARAGVGSVSDFMSRFNVYQVNDTLCLSHCLSLSHTSLCSPMHSPTFQSFTHPLILFLTLLLYFSFSLSFSFFLSFSPLHSLSGFLSQAFCLSFSFFITHTLAHTQ